MQQQTTATLPLSPTARLHVPWQGCWQVQAQRLREAIELQGLHLPLLAWEDAGRWEVAQLQLDDDDAILAAKLRWRDEGMEVTLSGDWKTQPRWETAPCGDAAGALAGARRALGIVPLAAHATHFSRMFVIDIHDPRGNLLQRFDDVRRFIETAADLGLAGGSLFYLAGWDGPFDGTYPDYVPAADAGGAAELARLVAAARAQGGEVMPHFNHWGLSRARSDAYPQLEPHILRDSSGAKAGWPGARANACSVANTGHACPICALPANQV